MRLPPRAGRAIVAGVAAVAAAAVALALTLLFVVDRDGDVGARLEVLDEHRLSPRMLEFTTRTPSLDRDVAVTVRLPAGYEASERSYPVLYLLPPTGGDRRFWTDLMGVGELTEGLPLIVVMPDAGKVGFYTDWREIGDRSAPQWETYHIEELIPWIDSEFRTVDGRDGRAVAGASMGGLGALMYAGRHPDLFAAAASLSGPAELKPQGMLRLLGLVGRGPALAERIWGPPDTELKNWVVHDPVAIASGYREVDLILLAGNGRPEGSTGPVQDPVEGLIYRMNLNLHRRLSKLGIRHVWAPGAGGHGPLLFRQELERTLPELMEVLRARGG